MNIIIDCESSGPCPVFGDLIEFAAAAENGTYFKSDKFPPMFPEYQERAYKTLKISRAEHLAYTGDMKAEFERFEAWVKALENPRHVMWSDNPAYDWQWINFGFAYIRVENPLGHSARRIGDLFAGLNGKLNKQNRWKGWRQTRHTHDPLDDVKGNMEAFLEIRRRYKL